MREEGIEGARGAGGAEEARETALSFEFKVLR
jgi:hypothetical protein